jgi:hypothetical protein
MSQRNTKRLHPEKDRSAGDRHMNAWDADDVNNLVRTEPG